jgi:neurofibromin 1
MQSLGTSGPAATPQQKVVQVLVNRLKNKVGLRLLSFEITRANGSQLPCHSGFSLARVEGDLSMRQTIETLVSLSRDSLDMIVWALTELLDRLAKVCNVQYLAGIANNLFYPSSKPIHVPDT